RVVQPADDQVAGRDVSQFAVADAEAGGAAAQGDVAGGRARLLQGDDGSVGVDVAKDGHVVGADGDVAAGEADAGKQLRVQAGREDAAGARGKRDRPVGGPEARAAERAFLQGNVAPGGPADAVAGRAGFHEGVEEGDVSAGGQDEVAGISHDVAREGS